MPGDTVDHALLFGVMALQMDLLGKDALLLVLEAWIRDRSQPLPNLLHDRGLLDDDDLTLLEAAVRRSLQRASDRPAKSLARLSVLPVILSELACLGDADVDACLKRVAAAGGPDSTSVAGAAKSGIVTSAARYRILRELGGNLGTIYLARDEDLDREVILKEIQDRYADDTDSRARFLREAKLTACLGHAGIVPVHTLGYNAEGRMFYVMRYVKGENLRAAIERYHRPEPGETQTPPTLRDLVRRFVQVCQAVAIAHEHERRVLHRDLKPENVMLGPDGDTVVIDWGLAKSLEKAKAGDGATFAGTMLQTDPTRMGVVLGTLAYMSPEQAAGEIDQLSPASDVYSLGATLYCILTGQSLFPNKGEWGQILSAVLQGRFTPPREVNPTVPPALEAICLKAMSLRPSDRYPSARALAIEVERWLDDEPVSVYTEPWSARMGRWGGHRPLLLMAASAAPFIVLAAILLALYLGRPPAGSGELGSSAEVAAVQEQLDSTRSQLQRATSSLADSQKNLVEARAAEKKVQDQLAQAEKLKKRAEVWGEKARTDMEAALEAKERAAREADTSRQQAAEEKARAEQFRDARDDLRARQRRADENLREATRAAEKMGEVFARTWQALTGAKEATPARVAEIARLSKYLADVLYLLGRPAEAQKYYHAALVLHEKLSKDDPGSADARRRLARAWNDLAWLLVTSPDDRMHAPKEAQAYIESALEVEPENPDFHNTLGIARYRLKMWEPALEALGKSIELCQKIPDSKGRARAIAQNRYFRAMAQWQLGNRQEAEQEYDQALECLAVESAEDEELYRFREEARALLGPTARALEKKRLAP